MHPISNAANRISSFDIEARIEDLKSFPFGELSESSQEELVDLIDLSSICRDVFNDDWEFGTELINDAYFEEFAREYAQETGALSNVHSWPLSHVNWATAASDLKMEYTPVEFNGVTFYGR